MPKGLPGEQRGTYPDLSDHGHDGTVYNKAAMSFDGVGDSLAVIPTFDALGGSRYACLAGHLFLTGSGERLLYWEALDTSSGSAAVYINITAANYLKVYAVGSRAVGGDSGSVTIATAISEDVWHSYLIVIDAADSKLYAWIDGAVYAYGVALSGDLGVSVWGASTPQVNQQFGLLSSVWDYSGRMAGIRLGKTDTLPTLADAQRVYDWPLSFDLDVTWGGIWHLNDGAGAPQDSSGNGHHLTATGAIWLNAANLGQVWTDSAGDANDSFQAGGMEFFAALEQAIDLNIAATVNALTACTMVTWLKHIEVGANHRFFAASDVSDASSDWSIGSQSVTGKGYALCREQASGTILQVRSPSVMTLDGSKMQCLAFASDVTGNTFMVDGQVATDYLTGDAATQATPSLVADIDRVLIGAREDSSGPEYFIEGTWYRTDIYNRRLGVAELQTLTARGPWR